MDVDWLAVWTALLFLTTGVLALVAWRTMEATKRDLEAQWRPILLPPTMAGVTEEFDNFHLTLVNSGRGPAIRAVVWSEDKQGRGPFHLAAGECRDPVKVPQPYQITANNSARVHVEWEDLTGTPPYFESVLTISRDGQGTLFFVDAKLVMDKAERQWPGRSG